eukprot:45631-Eustigmatos_ZCMA.PRE.1
MALWRGGRLGDGSMHTNHSINGLIGLEQVYELTQAHEQPCVSYCIGSTGVAVSIITMRDTYWGLTHRHAEDLREGLVP